MLYRYSGSVVYNNFPWSAPSAEQKGKVEATAQGVLDARAKCPALMRLYEAAVKEAK